MNTVTADVPRIYVASLADYNAGHLHGMWIDLDPGMTADDIHDQIAVMLHTSTQPLAEEWAIHDYEGFAGATIDEYESIDRIAALAEAINEHGPAYAAYIQLVGTHYVTPDDFQDKYYGAWESEEAFAESTVDEGLWGEISDRLAAYIDYQKIARDLFMGDFSSVHMEGVAYVFSEA